MRSDGLQESIFCGCLRFRLRFVTVIPMIPPNRTQSAALGATLREMRESVGLRQSDVAKALKTSVPTISLYERGKRTISAELLAQFTRLIADEVARIRGDVA